MATVPEDDKVSQLLHIIIPFYFHPSFFAFYYVYSDLDIIHATGYIEDVQEDVRKFITKSLYY